MKREEKRKRSMKKREARKEQFFLSKAHNK
jgi:hypothetical protein